MPVQAVLLPVFVQVALTLVLLFMTGRARVVSVRSGETKVKDIALGQPSWPARVTQVGNSYNSQFQLPILFYLLVAFAWPLHKADLLFVVMSWLFVATRLVHAYIHVTSNHVGRRFNAFAAGFLVLSLMWLIFAVRILLGLQ
jgi:hypothetical protein